MTDLLNARIRKVPAWVIYVLGFGYMGWLFWIALTGGMGVDPVKALEHAYGETGLKLLVLGLAVTPLRQFANVNLLKFRRAFGVTAFMYILAHLLVWLILDVQIPEQIWADIIKRPYITIGMGAFMLLLPLAVTSNNLSVRRLGPNWRRLHWLVYLAVPLGAVHFVMLAKGFQLEPLVYLTLACGLVCLRLKSSRRMAVSR